MCKKIDVEQLNGSQGIEEYKKSNYRKTGQRIPKISSPGESDKCGNNFMHLNQQDNSL